MEKRKILYGEINLINSQPTSVQRNYDPYTFHHKEHRGVTGPHGIPRPEGIPSNNNTINILGNMEKIKKTLDQMNLPKPFATSSMAPYKVENNKIVPVEYEVTDLIRDEVEKPKYVVPSGGVKHTPNVVSLENKEPIKIKNKNNNGIKDFFTIFTIVSTPINLIISGFKNVFKELE